MVRHDLNLLLSQLAFYRLIRMQDVNVLHYHSRLRLPRSSCAAGVRVRTMLETTSGVGLQLPKERSAFAVELHAYPAMETRRCVRVVPLLTAAAANLHTLVQCALPRRC